MAAWLDVHRHTRRLPGLALSTHQDFGALTAGGIYTRSTDDRRPVFRLADAARAHPDEALASLGESSPSSVDSRDARLSVPCQSASRRPSPRRKSTASRFASAYSARRRLTTPPRRDARLRRAGQVQGRRLVGLGSGLRRVSSGAAGALRSGARRPGRTRGRRALRLSPRVQLVARSSRKTLPRSKSLDRYAADTGINIWSRSSEV
jgi:hypothetical protein